MGKETELKELILNAKNVILTGAPGTGKTFLAKKIAHLITDDTEGNESHIAFCQFHPSYDYTDFVEGLRPTPPKNGNIGFERQDGVFMAFCRKVLVLKEKTYGPMDVISVTRDNFKESWDRMLDFLKNNSVIPVKYLQKDGSFDVGFNAGQAGLARYVYQTEEEKTNHNPNKMVPFMNYEQLYNIYKGERGVRRGGGDNYRKAVIKMMKAQFGLKDYRNGNMLDSPEIPQKYVFIIDEINRGDIAKIFGELFYAIDPGYRGEKGKIPTQYTNLNQKNEKDPFKDGFYVPENVYIIGTMNDIDRNVESMDFAIRRRFTWVEIEPKETQDMLDTPEMSQYAKKAKECMNVINEKICGMEGLGPAYQLGAAYFLKLKDYQGDFEHLWDYDVGPLLKEYLRGIPNAEEKLEELKSVWTSSGIQPETENVANNSTSEQQ